MKRTELILPASLALALAACGKQEAVSPEAAAGPGTAGGQTRSATTAAPSQESAAEPPPSAAPKPRAIDLSALPAAPDAAAVAAAQKQLEVAPAEALRILNEAQATSPAA